MAFAGFPFGPRGQQRLAQDRCGRPLGRPIAFVGSVEEVGRNAFHLPPLHVECAQELVGEATQVVTTAGFEFVRPAKEDLDRRPTFQPNSLL